MTTSQNDWFQEIPKVELHLHLEGAIPLSALWELVRKYGGDAQVPSMDALRRRFEYRDFAHFIELWHWKNGFIREYEDLTYAAEATARHLAAQNIRYVEAFFSPVDLAVHGLETQELIASVRTGLDRVDETDVRLVIDLVRDTGPEFGAQTLEQVHEVGDCGVIGIGIGGSEHKFPPEPYRDVYRRARDLGFRTSAHAGEVAGASSVWGAVRSLQVDRIGHGTRAHEDPELLDYLAAHQIPIEMCPVSNVRTGVVSSLAEHPVRDYFERGLLVTVNTDDPTMFGNSLAEEYRLLSEQQGFSRAEICQMIENGIRAAWLSAERRAELLSTFRNHSTWDATHL